MNNTLRSTCARGALVLLAFGLSGAALPGGVARAAEDVLSGSRTALAEAALRVQQGGNLLERAQALLDAGRPDEALELLGELERSGAEGDLLAARLRFAVQDFAGLRSQMPRLESRADDEARELVYLWLFTIDDLAEVDRRSRAALEGEPASVVDLLAAGRLAWARLDNRGAAGRFEAAARHAATAATRAAAARGLGMVAYKDNDYDGALGHHLEALDLAPLDPEVLMAVSETLIRLGRTDEAISAAELAVRAAPYHERAHYYLGNGYARKNYTQLFAAYPGSFASGGAGGESALQHADRLFSLGKPDIARTGYVAIHLQHPEWADVSARLGSVAFEQGDLPAAREYFLKSLAACPEYGRAHNGLAKVLEAERLAIEVHRDRYEATFAETPVPEVPRIEEFILNWSALSPRHRKQVALAVAPWERYLPVLIEGGATYYIKPLHELLSETPGQEVLRDQRINYDSRLWDDVRGCGGYRTVTGVEDVERTILGRYNTVLHELTHQVHYVLTADRKRQIQELYRRTKIRDEASDEDAFLSRYAGGSVWEYFAEGANALYSPQRDAYDTRDIVRERLVEMDPALQALVVELMTEADVESTYAVAYANRGDDGLERGEPLEAIASFHRALDRDPAEESALGSLIFALTVVDSADAAVDWAGRAAMLHPDSGALAGRRANAFWHSGYGLDAAIAMLRDARAQTREEERHLVDLTLGGLLWNAGDAEGARAAYQRVLDYQSDNPEGLWGLASAHALAGDWDRAWDIYEQAVRIRTGVVALRNGYAFDLLRAGETARAREQVEAALLLDADDPRSLALRGWIELAEGDPRAAAATAEMALGKGEWCDLARIVKARAEEELGHEAEANRTLAPLRARLENDAPPEYVYLPRWGRYEEVHTLPAVERALLDDAGTR